MMEYPRLVYRSASDHVLVETPEEFEARLSDGWFATVPEAQAGKHDVQPEAVKVFEAIGEAARAVTEFLEPEPDLEIVEPENVAPLPAREELETQARELDIKFDGRNSNASLQRMIDEALKA